MSISPIRIELFGGLRVIAAGNGPIEISRQQTGALLGYLALNCDKCHNREELVEVLWPDDDHEDGRRKLRQSIYALRRQFEPDSKHSIGLFISTRDTIGLNPDLISTDVRDFEAAVRRAAACEDPRDRMENLLSADALYRGELLAGFYQDELLYRRTDFAARYRIALQETVRAHERLGDLDSAITTARRIVAQDPLTEEAHTDLMRLYASAGRPSEVRRQLHELERLFTAELGANPSEATYNLAHRLRAEAELVAPSADCHHETPGPIASHPPVKTPARTPYGRFVAALGIALLVISLAIWSVSRSPLTKGLPAAKRVKAVTPHGHLFWRKRYAPKRGDRDSAPVAIVTDKRGYFVVGGFVQTLKTDVDMLVAKYDPYGARLWEYRYDGDGHDLDRLKAMAVGPDGAVYAACESMGKTGCENERLSELDMVVIKLDSYGNKIWDHRYRGKSNGLDSPADIGIDTAGNVYVAGRSWQAHAASHGLVVLKYSPSGKRLWEYQSPHEGRDERAVNMVVRDHAVYVAAHSASISSSPGDSDLFLKLSAEGKQEWRQAFSGVSSGSLTSPRVAVDKDDAVYLAVESAPDTSHGAIRKSKIVLTKFSPDKTEVWRKELPARTDDADVTTDLNADPRGGVVFTGLRRGQVAYILCGSYSSAGVIRYLHKIYTDPGESKAPSMSVDRDGNVAVTGSIFTGIGSTGHSYDAITAFIRADGEMLWRDWYDGPDHERDMGMAVTTQEGKIYVAVQATEGGISEVQIFRYSPFPEKLSGR